MIERIDGGTVFWRGRDLETARAHQSVSGGVLLAEGGGYLLAWPPGPIGRQRPPFLGRSAAYIDGLGPSWDETQNDPKRGADQLGLNF